MAAYITKYFSREKSKDHVLRLDKEDYDRSYAVPSTVLKVIGLRLMENKDSLLASICWDIYYWFEFINIFVAFWLEGIKMWHTANNARSGSLEDIVGSFRMVPCIGYLPLSLTKTYKMKRTPSIYKNTIRELKEMFPEGTVTEEEYKIIQTALSRLNYANKGYYWWNNISLFLFLVGSFQTGVKWAMGHDVLPVLPFEYWFPFDPAQSVFCFMSLLILQIWHSLISIWFSMCGDVLLFTFLTHITMQFDLLAIKITKFIHVPIDEQLIPEYPLGVYSAEKSRNIRERPSLTEDNNVREEQIQDELKTIIRRQHDLIRLAADIEAIYSFSMLVHFFDSSINICFCTFCSALVESWNEVGYKCFLFLVLSESLLLCWYGQRLIEASQGISKAAYNSGWYKASAEIRNTVLIMILRAQKPLCITTYGFSIISLTTFTTLIKSAWSYFTLILNLYKIR